MEQLPTCKITEVELTHLDRLKQERASAQGAINSFLAFLALNYGIQGNFEITPSGEIKKAEAGAEIKKP